MVPQLPDSCSTVGLRRLRGAPDLGQVPLHMRGPGCSSSELQLLYANAFMKM